MNLTRIISIKERIAISSEFKPDERDFVLDCINEAIERRRAPAQEPAACECGFAREVCATNLCMRKKVHLAGLTPGSKWPEGAPVGEAPAQDAQRRETLVSSGTLRGSERQSPRDERAQCDAPATTCAGKKIGNASPDQEAKAQISTIVLMAILGKADGETYGASHARKMNEERAEKAAERILAILTPAASDKP